MANDHEQRRADTIPALDRTTTGNSPNSRSGSIDDATDEDAKRMDHRYAEHAAGGDDSRTRDRGADKP